MLSSGLSALSVPYNPSGSRFEIYGREGSLFITGGTGFVGSYFLRSLDPLTYPRIVCLSRTRSVSAAKNIEFLQGDLLDRAGYARALSECDAVVHLAAATGKCRPETYFQVNLEGTRALVEECRRAGTKRFLYVSTIAVKFLDKRRTDVARHDHDRIFEIDGSALAIS